MRITIPTSVSKQAAERLAARFLNPLVAWHIEPAKKGPELVADLYWRKAWAGAGRKAVEAFSNALYAPDGRDRTV